MTVWGGPRSTLRSASADLQQAQGERPLPGMDSGSGGGRNDREGEGVVAQGDWGGELATMERR